MEAFVRFDKSLFMLKDLQKETWPWCRVPLNGVSESCLIERAPAHDAGLPDAAAVGKCAASFMLHFGSMPSARRRSRDSLIVDTDRI